MSKHEKKPHEKKPHEKKQSVFEEPHLREDYCAIDPSEEKASWTLASKPQGELEQVEQSVFEEVALRAQLDSSQLGNGALPEYLAWRRDQFSPLAALAFFVLICLLAMVFSFVVGVVFSITMTGFTTLGILGAVTLAPPVEEFAKILLPVWLIELRPWLFRWGWEVPLVCIAGGLGFAMIENLAYLNLYIDNPGLDITVWRWTICTGMHVAGASISSIGVMRYWKSRFAPASPGHVASPVRTIGPYLIIAIILHATYNLGALLLELFNPDFFG